MANGPSKIMDKEAVGRALMRIAHEIVEKNKNTKRQKVPQKWQRE